MNEAVIKKSITELREALLTSRSKKVGHKTSSDDLLGHFEPSSQIDPERALQEIHLRIKYLIFDLEATRRENRYLTQMLDNRRRGEKD